MKKAIIDTNKEQQAALRKKMYAEGKFPVQLAALYGFQDHLDLATYMRGCGHEFSRYQSELGSLYGIIGCQGLEEGDLRAIWEVA